MYFNKYNQIVFEIKNGYGGGKEYNYNGELKFEGEYLNGERNGKGTEYYNNGKIRFEGEYLEQKVKLNWKNIFDN